MDASKIKDDAELKWSLSKKIESSGKLTDKEDGILTKCQTFLHLNG